MTSSEHYTRSEIEDADLMRVRDYRQHEAIESAVQRSGL
jgi:hypothetical protein